MGLPGAMPCGHFWFHKDCEICKRIEKKCEENYQAFLKRWEESQKKSP